MMPAYRLSALKTFLTLSLDGINLPKAVYSMVIEYAVDDRGFKYFAHMFQHVGDWHINGKFDQSYDFERPMIIASCASPTQSLIWNFAFSTQSPESSMVKISIVYTNPVSDNILCLPGLGFTTLTDLWDFINGEQSCAINDMIKSAPFPADIWKLIGTLRKCVWRIVAHSFAMRDCADAAVARNLRLGVAN